MVAPKLRFKEFDEDWKLSTLSDISEIITGSTPSTSKSEYYDGNFLFVSPADIQENRYVEATKTTLTKEGFRKCRQIPNNSILFVCIGSTIGKIAQNKEICATNQQINAVVPNENHISDFLYLALDRIAPSIKLTAGIQAIPLINKTQFGKTTLSTPIFEEQTKIATFLSAVDEKIAQLSQKRHLLGQYKQGMMQKLFSQKIRFKADDGSEFGEWENTKLGELLIKHEEKTDRNNQYPVLTSSRNGIFFQKDYFAGQDVASSDTTGYNVVPYGYFTYRHMSDDVVFKFNINTLCEKGIVSTLYPVFTIKETHLNKYFLQTVLNEGKEFKNFAIMQKQGGSRTYMYYSKLKELVLYIPTLPEQTQIANFLSAIDQKFDVVSEQLKQAKTWKKGLLQQMFV